MSIKDKIRSFSDERWAIGIVDVGAAGPQNLGDILSNGQMDVHWVTDKQRSRWFADPFILSADDDNIVVLCEEMCFDKAQQKRNNKRKKVGRISKVIVDRATYTIKDVKCILELDTHLSFPAYYKKDGEIYVYPENSEGGGLTLYRYNQRDERLEPVQKISNDPVADAVITDLFGKRLMFCTKLPDPNGKALYVYEWDKETQLFVQYDVRCFDENVARMSGNFFECKGKVYRPTQECNVQYGHAVTLQEMKETDGRFDYKEVRRIYSTHPYLKTGCHTFNVHVESGLIAVDALGFDRMWFRKILKFFRILK